ncbi:SpoIIAA family protein [Rhizorhapis suberifaciens]|uniref:STAS/SEC14 domain-containing protein n=1 Tax=Rhizorhapis suberifaciens TaxID=13656 RepID=A0A840HVZ2_9SPHN|nr:STAS/SEC14 domain-containing protein [Rhizorhapis suberifaciens]MBB4642225.1 hypothetical protein [Rhizorhapis suberifaciens]
MLSHRLDSKKGIVEIEIDGAADTKSYRTLITDMDQLIAANGKISVLEIVRDIGWLSPGIWWEDLGWSFRHLKDIARVAIVTDKSWIKPIVKMMAGVMSAEVATFALDELDKARSWIAR